MPTPNTSLYYLHPTALSIQAGANGNDNDLAVTAVRGAKFKLYSPEIPNLGYEDNEFQQWTITARNKRFLDNDAYYIYARLNKLTKSDGIIVFSKNEYVLSENTTATDFRRPDGSISPGLPAAQLQNDRQNYWWVLIGEVSAVSDDSDSSSEDTTARTVDFSTGILGTTQWNNSWEEVVDEVPVRVEVTNSRTGMADTPFLEWGETISLTASLIKRWTTDITTEVKHWSLTRNTGSETADTAWNDEMADEIAEAESDSSDSDSSAGGGRVVIDAEGHLTVLISFNDTRNDLGTAGVDPVFTFTAYDAEGNILASMLQMVYKDAPAEREWIYYRNSTNSCPNPNTSTSGWTSEMQGVTETLKFEFGSYRDKPRKATAWSSYRFPAILVSHFGERGTDGDGAEYVFARSITKTPPQIQASDTYQEGGVLMDYTKDDYRPPVSGAYTVEGPTPTVLNRTTDDPKGVTKQLPYEWVAMRTKGAPNVQTGVRTWNEYETGNMSLWATYSEDGGTPDYRYQWGSSATQAPTFSSDTTNPGSGWQVNPPNRPSSGTNYLWEIMAIKQADGTYKTNGVGGHIWGNPVRLTGDTGTAGEDARDQEFVYKVLNVYPFPNNVTKPADATRGKVHGEGNWIPAADQYDTDDWVPEGWSDTALPAAENNKYVYVALRTKAAGHNEQWGDFGEPLLWSNWGVRGMDGDGVEYVFIRSKNNTPPVILDDDDYTDSNGADYIDDEHLPRVVARSDIEADNAEDDSSSGSDSSSIEFPYECTDDPKGTSEEWPYEWVAKRTKQEPVNGVRTWNYYSGQMALWANWSENGVTYNIDTNFEHIVIPSDSQSKTETLNAYFKISEGEGPREEVTLYSYVFYKALDGTMTFVAYGGHYPEIEGQSLTVTTAMAAVVILAYRTFVDPTDTDFFTSYSVMKEIPVIKDGDTGEDGVTYRAKWELLIGSSYVEYSTLPALSSGSVSGKTNATGLRVTLMKRVGDGAEGTATEWTSVLTIGGSSISAPSPSVSFDSTSTAFLELNSSSVKKASVTFSKGTTTQTFTIPKIMDGEHGDTGPMLYPAGEWQSSVTYTKSGDRVPYVLYNENYYYLTAASASGNNQKPPTDPTTSNNYWTKIPQMDVVFAKFGIMDYGKMASAIFCGDWMYSQYGKLYTSASSYYIVDNIAHSTDSEHWKYDVVWRPTGSSVTPKVPYAWFDADFPEGGSPATFAPNWAVDLKTGAQYGAAGNFIITKDGDVEVTGTIKAKTLANSYACSQISETIANAYLLPSQNPSQTTWKWVNGSTGYNECTCLHDSIVSASMMWSQGDLPNKIAISISGGAYQTGGKRVATNLYLPPASDFVGHEMEIFAPMTTAGIGQTELRIMGGSASSGNLMIPISGESRIAVLNPDPQRYANFTPTDYGISSVRLVAVKYSASNYGWMIMGYSNAYITVG